MKLGPDHPDTLLGMNNLAGTFLGAERWAEAESTLRGCLELRKQTRPDDWWCFHTMSQLGVALTGQTRYAEAEPRLIQGYEGLKSREAKIPAWAKKHLAQAAARLVPFYVAWGKPEQAAAWEAKLGPAGLPADPCPRGAMGRRTPRDPEGHTGRPR